MATPRQEVQKNTFWPEGHEFFGLSATEESEARGNISVPGVLAERRSYQTIGSIIEQDLPFEEALIALNEAYAERPITNEGTAIAIYNQGLEYLRNKASEEGISLIQVEDGMPVLMNLGFFTPQNERGYVSEALGFDSADIRATESRRVYASDSNSWGTYSVGFEPTASTADQIGDALVISGIGIMLGPAAGAALGAPSAVASAIISGGIKGITEGSIDPEQFAKNLVTAYISAGISDIANASIADFFPDELVNFLSAENVAGSFARGAITDAFTQAIQDGSIDVSDVLIGGLQRVGLDVISDAIQDAGQTRNETLLSEEGTLNGDLIQNMSPDEIMELSNTTDLYGLLGENGLLSKLGIDVGFMPTDYIGDAIDLVFGGETKDFIVADDGQKYPVITTNEGVGAVTPDGFILASDVVDGVAAGYSAVEEISGYGLLDTMPLTDMARYDERFFDVTSERSGDSELTGIWTRHPLAARGGFGSAAQAAAAVENAVNRGDLPANAATWTSSQWDNYFNDSSDPITAESETGQPAEQETVLYGEGTTGAAPTDNQPTQGETQTGAEDPELVTDAELSGETDPFGDTTQESTIDTGTEESAIDALLGQYLDPIKNDLSTQQEAVAQLKTAIENLESPPTAQEIMDYINENGIRLDQTTLNDIQESIDISVNNAVTNLAADISNDIDSLGAISAENQARLDELGLSFEDLQRDFGDQFANLSSTVETGFATAEEERQQLAADIAANGTLTAENAEAIGELGLTVNEFIAQYGVDIVGLNDAIANTDQNIIDLANTTSEGFASAEAEREQLAADIAANGVLTTENAEAIANLGLTVDQFITQYGADIVGLNEAISNTDQSIIDLANTTATGFSDVNTRIDELDEGIQEELAVIAGQISVNGEISQENQNRLNEIGVTLNDIQVEFGDQFDNLSDIVSTGFADVGTKIDELDEKTQEELAVIANDIATVGGISQENQDRLNNIGVTLGDLQNQYGDIYEGLGLVEEDILNISEDVASGFTKAEEERKKLSKKLSIKEFKPFTSGISYKPLQLEGLIETPKKDYVNELNQIINRSLFEGMI